MKNFLRLLFVFSFVFSNISLYASNEPPGKVEKKFAAITATILGTATVCQNTAGIKITFNGSGGTAPYTFTYKINTGATATVTTTGTSSSVTVSVNTSAAGTFIYNLLTVHDATMPIAEENVSGSATVTVNPQPNANMGGTGSGSTFDGIPVFRMCGNTATQFSFTNTSTTTGTNTEYTIDWGDGSPNFNGTSWSSLTHTYQVGLKNLTYTIKGTNGCSITKKYIVFVGSNPAVSLGNPGNTDICNANSLTFPITGTDNNPPGTTYTVTFNDGSTPEIFNHPPPASVTHKFIKSSCGTGSSDGSNSYPNSFSANIVATNPCSTSSVGVVPIYVSANPQAKFTGPTNGCQNKSVCFTNASDGNQVIGNTCSSPATIWTITPSTGFTILNGGTLGNDFSSNDPSLWLSGSDNLCINFTSPGTYSITMKTGNRCGIDQITKTICIEPSLTPQFSLNTVSGCAPLAVTANNTTVVTNSCTPPTYTWSVTYSAANCGTTITTIPNQTTQNASFNFTEPGTYTVKLTATNSCGSTETTQTVTVKKPPTVTIASIPNSCGSASIAPTATVNSCAPASSTLTYAWSFPGGTPATANTANPGTINYSATGNHTVSLVVTNECGASATATQTFTVSASPTITNTGLSQSICSGSSTTAVNLAANPATATFTWTATATAGITGFIPSGTTNTIPAQIISTTNSSVGTVTYVITPSLGGCVGPAVNYVITVNPAPNITTQPASSIICVGGTATPLSVALSGGSGTYQWYSHTSNSNTGGTIISGETNASFNPPTITAGTVYYYCVITLTSGGCSNVTSNVAQVVVNPMPAITTQPQPAQSLCVGSTIATPLSVASTGTPTYQWYSNSSNANTGGTIISGATNSTFTPPVFTSTGTYYYYVVITYAESGCGNLTSAVAKIEVLNGPTFASQPLATQTVCQGTAASNLEVTPAGSGTFTYQWYSNTIHSNAGGTLIPSATNAVYTPTTSTAGTTYYYCVVVQNAMPSCNMTSIAAKVVVNLSPAVNTQPISGTYCKGNSATALSFTINNGVGTPNYQWFSNTDNSIVNGTLIVPATNATFTPPTTAVGTVYYYCTITFPSLSGGCGVVNTNPTMITVNENPVIANENTTICSSATFSVTPSTTTSGNIIPAGTTYTWTNPLISPAGSVTGASAQATAQNSISQTLINITSSPATVTYTVTPKAGICAGNTFKVTVIVNPAINANVVANNSACFGSNNASITANITGGIPPYNVSWTGSNGFTSSSTSIPNLLPGNYDLSITDAGGCPFSKTYTITEPADILITTVNKSDITCFGSSNGAISIEVTGGTGNYNYTWTKDGNPFASTANISNLNPGVYEISVTDANNCGPKKMSYIIVEPPVLTADLLSQTNILCYGTATGAITVKATGGVPKQTSPDYDFSWKGPNGFTSANQNLSNIYAGNYILTVTDAQGCTNQLAVNLTQSSEIIVNYTKTALVCYGDSDASISASISGGNPPYQYVWNNLATSLNQDNLSAGDYIITVTDNSGCEKIQKINIPSPPVFKINPIVSNISCFGAKDGSIQLNLEGGIKPVSLKWTDGSTAGLTRNNLVAGTYSFVITDSKPCKISGEYLIIEPQPLALSANVTNALDCDNANSGSLNLMVSGGTPPFNYAWSNGIQVEDQTNIPAGNYSISVTDSRGCNKMEQYKVTRPAPIALNVLTNTDANCDTKKVIQNFTANTTGGVPPYKLQWSSGTVSGTDDHLMTTDKSGSIFLEATDDLGCKGNYSFNVEIPVLGNPSVTTNSIGYSQYGQYSILDPIQFTTISEGDYENIVWDFGDGTFSNELNPVHTYKTPKDYVVTQTVTYPFGCVDVQKVTLSVTNGYVLVVPTAFTPNGDSLNDSFRPVTKSLKNVRLDVYDTWGSLIYSEIGDVLKGWDGKIKGQNAENGNYNCKVSAETFYGTLISEQKTFVLIN